MLQTKDKFKKIIISAIIGVITGIITACVICFYFLQSIY